jgi:hypothetical protein
MRRCVIKIDVVPIECHQMYSFAHHHRSSSVNLLGLRHILGTRAAAASGGCSSTHHRHERTEVPASSTHHLLRHLHDSGVLHQSLKLLRVLHEARQIDATQVARHRSGRCNGGGGRRGRGRSGAAAAAAAALL